MLWYLFFKRPPTAFFFHGRLDTGKGLPSFAAQQPDRPLAHQVPGVMGSQVQGTVLHRQHAETPARGK